MRRHPWRALRHVSEWTAGKFVVQKEPTETSQQSGKRFLFIKLLFMFQVIFSFAVVFWAGVVGFRNSPMALFRRKGKVATYWHAGEKMILSTFNSLVLKHFQTWSLALPCKADMNLMSCLRELAMILWRRFVTRSVRSHLSLGSQDSGL